MTRTKFSICFAGALGVFAAAFIRRFIDLRSAKALDQRDRKQQIQTLEAEGGIVLD